MDEISQCAIQFHCSPSECKLNEQWPHRCDYEDFFGMCHNEQARIEALKNKLNEMEGE